MQKSPPPKDFEIHVDPSCLSDDADNDATMSTERIASNESSRTVVHHDSWTEEEFKGEAPPANEIPDDVMEQDKKAEEKENSPPPADVEVKETTEEPEPETVDKSPDADEPAEDSEPDNAAAEEESEREARERRIERIEAEIQAAARAVVANIQQDHYDGNENSVLSAQMDGSCDEYDTEITCDGTEGTNEEGKDDSSVSDHEGPSERHSDNESGDSSSHHDGDVDDDVFSSSDRSKRSSMDSVHSSNDNQKLLTSPMVGEEAASASQGEPLSRIPSEASYMHTPTAAADRTPSKVSSRPPFRTPSSVRAMQMTSPTPSLFSSPRSTKRHLPTVSRIGTPNSQYSPSKRTPTRLKPRKAAPLVLLHVTVLPLQWPYAYLMSSPEIPESLQHVKESWRLLHDKIGDTVLERGILLSHPQESYEVLEERLYEALELPVRPRAKILKCGHYMGPLEPETPSSDEECDYFEDAGIHDGRKWCDICGREVRVEEVGDVPRGEKRFTVKIYASNGLMKAGAWEAAWREMERVDVELEPSVDTDQRAELQRLAIMTPQESRVEEKEQDDDGFVDEEPAEHVHDHSNKQEIQDARAREKEKIMAQMAKEEEMKKRIAEDDDMRKRMAEEEEMQNLMAEEAELKHRMAEEEAMRRHMDDQEAARQNEERMREMYRQEAEQSQSGRRSSSKSSVHDDSSFVELLLAAFKVVLRDSRNVAIGILSVLVLLLALSTKSTVQQPPLSMVMDNASTPQITTTVFKESPVASLENSRPTAEQVLHVASEAVHHEASSQITTTVIREYTVTEKVPAATSVENVELVHASESVHVSQVTTTVFREKTVTEKIPAPTPAEGVDPCESVVSAKSLRNEPVPVQKFIGTELEPTGGADVAEQQPEDIPEIEIMIESATEEA